jgi:hypothetical protein
MSSAGTERRLAEALDLAALELADLVRLAGQLEIAIAKLAARSRISDPETLADCQVADLLAQRLAGVSGFLSGLAADTPPDVRVDVTRAILTLTLGEQARRFSGPALGAAAVAEVDDAVFFADAP